MNPPRPSSPFVLALVLGCATATGAPPPGPAPPRLQDFRPIRFGDGDGDEQASTRPLFPDADLDSAITSPDEILGQPVGSRLAHHAEIVRAFRTLAEQSPRVTVATYGSTYEGRELVRAVITSEANHARLERIRDDLASLSDPRGLDDARTRSIVASSPAIAWFGYSIHGDETSGADASLAVGHYLAASRDADVARWLDEVVVVLDPCMNPDGRERILALVEQNAGYVPNLDYASMQRGRWPFGRGNHYLFDMNRDWMAGVCPETRGRWRVAAEFRPQLFVDAHEMSGLDTFLFYPQAEPHHPALPERLAHWQDVFAADCARAFDRQGWGYYTREWADAWGVFYSDSWGALNGAVGMLYEQASLGGQPLRRASGRVETYREAVHGQVVASLANLATLAEHRSEILGDYLAHRRRAVDAGREGGDRAFVLLPGRNPDRDARLVDLLLRQGVEVWRADEPFEARQVRSATGTQEASRSFEAGAYVVPAAQPQAALVAAYLEFDPRIDDASLLEERRSLETESESKVYDVTAWNLGQAFDLDAYWCRGAQGARTRVTEAPEPATGAADLAGERAYAWVVDGGPDRSVRFAARALELGLAIHVADEPFSAAGRAFPRGSLLLRRHENDEGLDELVARAALDAGVQAFAVATGRSPDEGPDLGGGHFHLLARPRVALLGNAPVASDAYGHLWHALDVELRLPVSLLDAAAFGGVDLRRYNVLVLPPAYGLEGFLERHAEALRSWIRAGGTLVACGPSAAAVASKELELTSVVLRRDALDELDAHAFAVERERAARAVEVDPAAVWGDPPVASPEDPDPGTEDVADAGDETADDGSSEPDLERRDEWMRRFAPSGVIVRGLVDLRSWLTFGSGEELPVLVEGSSVLLARDPVRTAVRLAPAERLRLSGLLWPEARERLADSAWATVEPVGNGQVVLFAAPPTFRGSFLGTARLFANAVVYGPGVGAQPPLGW